MKRRNFLASLLCLPFVKQPKAVIVGADMQSGFTAYRTMRMEMLDGYKDWETARARLRFLAKNDPYFCKFIHEIKANTRTLERLSAAREEVFQELMAHRS